MKVTYENTTNGVTSLIQKIQKGFCFFGSGTKWEDLPDYSSTNLRFGLLKRVGKSGESVQAIVMIVCKKLTQNILPGLLIPGSEASEIMRAYDCRILNVYALGNKSVSSLNNEDLAMRCVWVYGQKEIEQLGSREMCFLFPHNEYIYSKLYPAIEGGLTEIGNFRGGLVLPTGWGKSFLMARVVYDFPHKTTLIVCPTRIIQQQLRGLLRPVEGNVLVVTYAALLLARKIERKMEDESGDQEYSDARKLLEFIKYTEIAMFDEIHHSLGDEYREAVHMLLARYNPKVAVGFTATPMGGYNRNENSIDHHFDHHIVAEVPFNRAWQYALLPTPKVICPTLQQETGGHRVTEVVEGEVLSDKASISVEITDEAMATLADCLKDRPIQHVIYFLEKWETMSEAERLMRRAFQMAGFSEEEYRFLEVRGADAETGFLVSNKEIQATLKDYESAPADGCRVHVLFGAMMVKEGYHPHCRIDMAVIGYNVRSENTIVQMLGRTQFVQTALQEGKEAFEPVIVDFHNTTSVFRNLKSYIDLSGKLSPKRKRQSGMEYQERTGPGGTTVERSHIVDYEKAMPGLDASKTLEWDKFSESLSQFMRATRKGLPGECRGELSDAEVRHTVRNKRFFDAYATVLINKDHPLHKKLENFLRRYEGVMDIKAVLSWSEEDLTNEQRRPCEKLSDMYPILPRLIERMKFYERHFMLFRETMGWDMILKIRAFNSLLSSILQRDALPLFFKRYGVPLCSGMREVDDNVTLLVRLTEHINRCPEEMVFTTLGHDRLPLPDLKVANLWFRMIVAIERGEDFQDMSRELTDLLRSNNLDPEENNCLLEMGFRTEDLTGQAKQLSLVLRAIRQLSLQEKGSLEYHSLIGKIYRAVFSDTNDQTVYMEAIAGALMTRLGPLCRFESMIRQGGFSLRSLSEDNIEEAKKQYALSRRACNEAERKTLEGELATLLGEYLETPKEDPEVKALLKILK